MKTNSSRTLGAVVATAALALALAGCGSSGPAGSASGSPASPAPSSSSAPTSSGPTGGTGSGSSHGFPGAIGKVASVSGHSARLQGVGSSTKVTWTSATRVTRELNVARSAITPGTCVFALPAGPAAQRGSILVARTVRIVQPRACGVHTDPMMRPSHPRGVRRPGGRPFMDRMMVAAFGKVTKVTGNGFVVKSTLPRLPRHTEDSRHPTRFTVKVTKSTSYLAIRPVAASAIRAGLCATALGPVGSSGTVAARRIALDDPVAGKCGPQVAIHPGGPTFHPGPVS